MAKRLFRVWGGAGNRHGIQSHGDVLVNQLNDGTPLDELWVELTDVLDAYNKHRSTIASLVSYPTTNVADAVPQNVNAESFELATEYGVPQGISDPSYLKLAMNYRDYDLALRASWKYLRDATRDQWENRVTRAIEADNKLVNGLILQRLFSNVVYTNDFNLSCFGLWNGDGQVPPNHMGKTFDGNHTHYLTTLGTALTPLHVEAGIRHITEHGYAGAQAAKLLLLAHPDDIETSKLTSWRAGLEYASGSALPKFDFVPSSLAPAYLSAETLHGAAPPPDYNGLPVTGSYGKAFVIESYFIPAGWCAIVASGGLDSRENPVGFREHVNPAYRGLRVIPGHGPYPLVESFLARGCGTGVRHRGAALAIQITAGATYTPPTFQIHR